MIEDVTDILDRIARERMKCWNLEEFKRTHRSLYEVILLAASEYSSQEQKETFQTIKDFPEYFIK